VREATRERRIGGEKALNLGENNPQRQSVRRQQGSSNAADCRAARAFAAGRFTCSLVACFRPAG
jgi:hypothetical protein